MDNNFIKDNRVFPEEMYEAASAPSREGNKKNHTGSVLWWVLGLLVLLALVFFIGLWTGKKTTEVIRQRNVDTGVEQAQEAIDQQLLYETQSTPEEREERLRNFFGE